MHSNLVDLYVHPQAQIKQNEAVLQEEAVNWLGVHGCLWESQWAYQQKFSDE